MPAVVETIRDVLSVTAWEMETPKAYGPLHLIFMIGGFFLCFFLAWQLRHISAKTKNRILLGIGIFLVICEIYKQLMYEVVLEPGNGYRWGNFSFQLCSIPMYLCLIIPFLKEGTVRRTMCCFLTTYNCMGAFVAFFEPSGLLHGHWTLTLHALIWHLLLVFLGALIAFSGDGCRDIKDYKRATVLFCILCGMAFAINCIFWEISDHQIKMFFVGPGNSPIIVFKQISELFGWVVSTLLYIPSVCVGAYIFYFIFGFINQRRGKAVQKIS
jgi:hypothetical protein